MVLIELFSLEFAGSGETQREGGKRCADKPGGKAADVLKTILPVLNFYGSASVQSPSGS